MFDSFIGPTLSSIDNILLLLKHIGLLLSAYGVGVIRDFANESLFSNLSVDPVISIMKTYCTTLSSLLDRYPVFSNTILSTSPKYSKEAMSLTVMLSSSYNLAILHVKYVLSPSKSPSGTTKMQKAILIYHNCTSSMIKLNSWLL